MYFVFDPDPIDQDEPELIGPFATQDEAIEYANLVHPDDESGNAIVLEPIAP